MANNKLYIVDTKTGEKCLFSKGLCFGWEGIESDHIERLDRFLKNRDIPASSGDEPTVLKLITENEMPAGWANDAFERNIK